MNCVSFDYKANLNRVIESRQVIRFIGDGIADNWTI
jgi:hypothetical protein